MLLLLDYILGKVFIDWSQNAEHKTTVSVYSIRAKAERPYVSMPVTWKEVEGALTNRHPERLRFTPEDAIARIKERGNLFAPVLTLKQTIPKELQREFQLASVPRAEPVTIPESVSQPYRLPKSSGQGGRKLFVVHCNGSQFELGLELNGGFRLLRFAEFPITKNSKAGADDAGRRGLEYLTRESSEEGIVWDLGTYEVKEGSFEKGSIEVYMTGRRLRGAWSLRKTGGRWILARKPGKCDQGSRRRAQLSSLSQRKRCGERNVPADTRSRKLPGTDILLSDLPEAEPRFVRKMDCIAVDRIEEIPSSKDWFRELKWEATAFVL